METGVTCLRHHTNAECHPQGFPAESAAPLGLLGGEAWPRATGLIPCTPWPDKALGCRKWSPLLPSPAASLATSGKSQITPPSREASLPTRQLALPATETLM